MFMELNPKKEMPLLYRILRAAAITLSAVLAALFVGYAAWFAFSGPIDTLLDDITPQGIFQIVMIIVAIIAFFAAWYRPLNSSIIAILAVVGYIVIRSVTHGTLVLEALEMILLAIALLFLAQGLYKRWLENDGMEEILGPTVDPYDGPDISGLRL